MLTHQTFSVVFCENIHPCQNCPTVTNRTVRWTLVCVRFYKRFLPDSPCLAERSHGDRWDCTECASASESYPEKHNITGETWRNGRLKTTKHEAVYGIRSYPLFHDIISMVGHFLHDAEGSCMDSKDNILAFLSILGINDRPGACRLLSNLVCLYNPQSLLGGSLDNLEKSTKVSVYRNCRTKTNG